MQASEKDRKKGRAYRVLLRGSIEFGVTPTSLGSPLHKSGEIANPSAVEASRQRALCSKKKLGNPTFTGPSKPCTVGS